MCVSCVYVCALLVQIVVVIYTVVSVQFYFLENYHFANFFQLWFTDNAIFIKHAQVEYNFFSLTEIVCMNV